MTGRPVALLGHLHTCPKAEPGPVPHVGGPIIATQGFVRVGGIPVATVDGTCLCAGGGPDRITGGSSFVSIDGKPVARLGDKTEHGGVITQGQAYVLVE